MNVSECVGVLLGKLVQCCGDLCSGVNHACGEYSEESSADLAAATARLIDCDDQDLPAAPTDD